MARLSPQGPVYQAGTLSGNPLAVAAGRATLAQLTPDVYARLEAHGEALEGILRPVVEALGLSMTRLGSMLTVFFRDTPPTHFAEVKECDIPAFGRFHRACLDRGVYLPPSQFEAAFLPACLSDDDVAFAGAQMVDALRATVL